MAKDIRIVKTKQRLTSELPIQLTKHRKPVINEIQLLEKFINLDPIYDGDPNKFNVVGTHIKCQKQ
jgi:hypothetical protein